MQKSIAEAAARAHAALMAESALEALIARRHTAAWTADDELVAADLVRELCQDREPDGSWQGSVSRTAETLLLAYDLVGAADSEIDPVTGGHTFTDEAAAKAWHEAFTLLGPGIAWVFARMMEPAPATVDLTGLELDAGARFLSDRDARVGIAALSVAALSAWGTRHAALDTAVETLTRIVRLDPRDRSDISSVGAACIVTALAVTPSDAARDALPDAVAMLARMQRSDGSWSDGDVFFILAALLRVPDNSAQPLIARSAALLAMLQDADGGWGRQATAQRLLIGWRTLSK